MKETFETTNDFLKGIDVIYWINLDRSKDRRKKMEEVYNHSVFENIPINRFSAIDGNTDDVFSYFENDLYKNKKLSKNEYACFTSHLETIRLFSKSIYEIALIMEDDITLELMPYWKNNVETILQDAPKDWEVIQLCSIGDTYKMYDTYRPSAGAYLINKKGANKLMNLRVNDKYKILHHCRNIPIYHHADIFMFTFLKTYCYHYPLFIYEGDDSLLHSDHLEGHQKSKKKIIKRLKKETFERNQKKRLKN